MSFKVKNIIILLIVLAIKWPLFVEATPTPSPQLSPMTYVALHSVVTSLENLSEKEYAPAQKNFRSFNS